MSRFEYIQSAVQRVRRLRGSIAEAGVSTGDSAEAICKVKKNKKLHLFDTFTGLPEELFTPIDRSDKFSRIYIYPNAYEAPLEDVKERLSEYRNIYYHKGIIPKTFKGLERERYCFIHIDLDLYKSTLDALKYFLPRRVRDGVIMVHNYPDFVGVRKAVRDAGVEEVTEGKYKYCFL
jgi:hypothetical protein